jgi:dihydrofolate reductase
MTVITTGSVTAVRDDECQRSLVTPESAATRLSPHTLDTSSDPLPEEEPIRKDDDMRKIIAGLFVTLDGVTESPEQWQGPYFDHEMAAVLARQLTEADTLLLGRRTYEIFAGHWPAQVGTGNPIADRLNTMPKLVVSTTATTLDWHNSTVIRDDVAGELGRLTKEDGGNIQVPGSLTLVRWLLNQGLLDELALLVHPIAVGRGQRLFPDSDQQHRFTLLDAQPLTSGVLSLTYKTTTA